ncbi:MAG: methyltransferase domain-containing protein [Candidatus Melainabacteria bacterium]|nr:methyltransferase domain-containing protein [Candidatus Melainabacteria bacterium]
MTKPKGQWWNSFYEDVPFHLYLERHDAAELELTLRFLAERLHVQPGARLFDQCCGMGSLSIPLAERGYDVVGVDLCESFIARAKSDTADGVHAVEFFVGDAFQFVPDGACDGAFNWYTSFGYSADDDENVKMIERAFESLKPGAWFALDFPNVPMILANFKERMEHRLTTEEGEIVIARQCRIDNGVMHQSWDWTLPDGRTVSNQSTLRLYQPAELVILFQRAGFTEVELFGGLKGEERTDKSGRCVCVGRRPL